MVPNGSGPLDGSTRPIRGGCTTVPSALEVTGASSRRDREADCGNGTGRARFPKSLADRSTLACVNTRRRCPPVRHRAFAQRLLQSLREPSSAE